MKNLYVKLLITDFAEEEDLAIGGISIPLNEDTPQMQAEDIRVRFMELGHKIIKENMMRGA